ncbi:hypothetical protein [Chroococcidiopsis sp. SAG 2025]|uniref:hypothetical protein n=1 Tax=Chroococcidiopsis sp. SAG 2025 TaxID=171389 RepID=UPI002936D7EA|nr:hypothetical protein [Chroococcidiopsis sp. SAG 2025]
MRSEGVTRELGERSGAIQNSKFRYTLHPTPYIWLTTHCVLSLTPRSSLLIPLQHGNSSSDL